MYVDDTSSVVKSQQMLGLILSAQNLATGQAEWLEDNGMVVSPGKSKLLICANQELRRARVQGPPQGIVVAGQSGMPTPSERILGLYLDQDLTRRSYLWGGNRQLPWCNPPVNRKSSYVGKAVSNPPKNHNVEPAGWALHEQVDLWPTGLLSHMGPPILKNTVLYK